MPQPQSSVRPGLDPIALARLQARLARAEEPPWLHGEVARRMSERISFIKAPPKAVQDWSLESESSAPFLKRACPQAEVRVVQEAQKPANRIQADAKESWVGRWAAWWRPARASALEPTQVPNSSADLLWANMSLHLLADPAQVFRTWRQALRADGFLLFSTLGPGCLAQLREIYHARAWGVAHAPYTDMHDLGDMMLEAGLADPVMDQEMLTLTYDSPEALLEEMRTLGANVASERFPGCRTSAWRRALLEALGQTRGADGRWKMDVEIVYGHAFKAPDRGPAMAESTTIDLDAMKLMLRKPKSR